MGIGHGALKIKDESLNSINESLNSVNVSSVDSEEPRFHSSLRKVVI
ncbi:hypothetical protein GXM_03678 [Nostoc sphaeroides CCNUC1]|uniref:Uncharacterized protein n=1 Tax=Nostoc sphaeroides CCNUC1 TaxID=2653204 RepID=A0A5P8W0G2_9NOSO|nr:hypothetical protein GXM_03678 [Nostoc sphaeroides CCNUC1]